MSGFGLPVGRRMAAVKRATGRWALFSPVPLDADARSRLDREGGVDTLVVPTGFHNRFVAESAEAFPEATIYLAGGAKRHGLPQSRCHELAEAEWDDDLEALPLEGMSGVHEVTFHHKPSASLIVGDLCINVDERYPFLTRTLFRLVGAYPGPRTSKFFLSMIRDRKAFLASLDRILEREFDRVVVSHGVTIDCGGREAVLATRRQVAR